MRYGIEPNGYSWTRVLQAYLETNQPDIEKKLTYDSEAGMFACTGSKEIIQQAAVCFSELYNNDSLLETIIKDLSLRD